MTSIRVEPVPIAAFALDIAALAVLGNALIPLLLLDETVAPNRAQQGNALMQALNGVVYAVYALRLLLNAAVRSRLRKRITHDGHFWLPVAALLALALVSMAWSSEPQIALRRAVALIGTTGVGIFLALRYPPDQLLRLLLGVSVVFAVASIAMVILWPEKGLMQVSYVFANEHQGRWRGIFMHKNHLASLMAVGVVVAAGVLRGGGLPLFSAAFTLVLCMALLLLAESLTALLATVVALFAVMALRLLTFGTHDRRETVLATLPVLLLITAVAFYQLSQGGPDVDAVLAPAKSADSSADLAATTEPVSPRLKAHSDGFGRDATATGRLTMWRLCWDAIQLQPLRGYGYGTFWRTGGPAEQVWKRSHFRMPHAHNGWIDLALQLGLPLALLMAGWMLWLGARLLRRVRAGAAESDRIAGITLLGLWACFNVINLAETVLFRQHEFLSVLLFTIAACATLSRRSGAAQ